jgi:putative ABC transport system ATP-binding protein
LLLLCNRLIEPSAGRVEVLGRDVRAWPVQELRRSAVLVPQDPRLFGGTVREELALALSWAGRAFDDGALEASLRVAQLGELALDREADELSGGERARLALARALLLEPPLLLLDEPTASLDVRLARRLLEAVRAWALERDAALLVVTHRPDDLPGLGGGALVLLEGRLHGPYDAAALAGGGAGAPGVRAFLGTLTEEEPA